MTVTYRGDVYDVIKYSTVTRRLTIRLQGHPEAPIRNVGIRSVIMTPEVRVLLMEPLPNRWQDQFKSDPIVDTEP